MRNALDDTEPSYKEYLKTEGFLPSKVHQKRFGFTYNAELFEADQLLKDTFEKLVYRLTKKRLKKSYWNELRDCYREEGRFYHNLIHVSNVYKTLAPVKSEINDWEVLVFAVLYHDIAYDVLRNDNEEQSAAWAERVMQSLKIDPQRIERCKAHIIATKGHSLSSDPDTNLFTDADLSILGTEPETYANYSTNIRAEYAIYSDADYAKGRQQVLKSLLNLPQIYKTKSFNLLFEHQARANLTAELERLPR